LKILAGLTKLGLAMLQRALNQVSVKVFGCIKLFIKYPQLLFLFPFAIVELNR